MGRINHSSIRIEYTIDPKGIKAYSGVRHFGFCHPEHIERAHTQICLPNIFETIENPYGRYEITFT